MKKLFITAMAVILAVLSVPVFTAFAADGGELADVPILGYSESGKAYCLYDEVDGEYVLTYVNSKGTKQLYKSKEEFKHHESLSEDGKTLFYSINNTVYRYSCESGKRKKIYTAQSTEDSYDTHVYLNSSPSGEYCFICVRHPTGYNNYNIDLVIWHDGKTSSQTEKTNFGSYGGNTLFHINDKGEIFYTLDRDIYVLDFDGKRLAEKAPELSSEEDYEYGYETEVFEENGTYFIESENAAFYGEIGGERHTFSISPDCRLLRKSGEGFIAYNGEYIARYDIRSGKIKNILKISPEKYREKLGGFFSKFYVSDDLNEVIYINYSKKKLVRLSNWNAEKNRYTKRQEIALNGTGREYISKIYDANIVLIGGADEKSYYYQADFSDGSFVSSEKWDWDFIDRFGHKITLRGKSVYITNPDGSETKVFGNVGASFLLDSAERRLTNGFFFFYSGGPETEEYEGVYDLTYYYIDENGKAVKWFEDTDVYMERHFLEDWSEWE